MEVEPVETAPKDRPVWIHGGTYNWNSNKIADHRWRIAQWNPYTFEWKQIAFGAEHMKEVEEVTAWAPISEPEVSPPVRLPFSRPT